jgi:hypothetical protein
MSYIPVLLIGFSIQLVLSFVLPFILCQLGKWWHVTDVIHGILWPEFWSCDDDADLATRNRGRLEKKPTILLSSNVILCFDVLNNLMIMLTFGLCSPILAVAVTCTVVSKMGVLLYLVGRYTTHLKDSHCADGSSIHFGVVALGKVQFLLMEVLQRSFWLIAWTSALFFAMVCWDVGSDEVGLVDSIWIPALAIGYPLLLWMISYCARNKGSCQILLSVFYRDKKKEIKGKNDNRLELASLSSFDSCATTNNPLHLHVAS